MGSAIESGRFGKADATPAADTATKGEAPAGADPIGAATLRAAWAACDAERAAFAADLRAAWRACDKARAARKAAARDLAPLVERAAAYLYAGTADAPKRGRKGR